MQRRTAASDQRRAKRYPSDLTGEQWALLAPLVRRKPGAGRPARVALREVLSALLYVLRTGCQWAYLPRKFPHESTVRYYRRRWLREGIFEQINSLVPSLWRTQALTLKLIPALGSRW